MKVWIVIEHIDRGSDEFRIKRVFNSETKALEYLNEHYQDWSPLLEEDEDEADFDPLVLEYFQDGDDQNDSVSIEAVEVE